MAYFELSRLRYARYLQSRQGSMEKTKLGSNTPYKRCPSSAPSVRSVPSVEFLGTIEHHPPYPRISWRVKYDAPAPAPVPASVSASASAPSRSPGQERWSYSPEFGLVNPDIIDRMDNVGEVPYHHEGPFDPAYAERNRCSRASPVRALSGSINETFKATPGERIAASVENNCPLDGTALYPSGHTDLRGHKYEYEEGPNMMNDYGNLCVAPAWYVSSSFLSDFVLMHLQRLTDEDFRDDPFYNSPLPEPYAFIWRVIERCRRSCRRRTN